MMDGLDGYANIGQGMSMGWSAINEVVESTVKVREHHRIPDIHHDRQTEDNVNLYRGTTSVFTFLQ